MAAVTPFETDMQLAFRPFDDRHLSFLVNWIPNPEALHWLAPSTTWPLTVDKMRAWKRENGQAYGLYRAGEPTPIAYGELNPMRSRPDHLWIGHVIVDPAFQRRGHGTRFVNEMVQVAFQKQQATRLILVVFPANTSAIQCYHRVGFKTVGEEFHAFGGSPGKQRLLRLEMTPSDCPEA